MAIDPNVFYRAGAIKGDLARQAKQDRQQSFQRAVSGIASVTKMIGDKQDQYDKNMSDFNGEIPREVVPEAAMMDLTRHIAREKAVYTKNAKIMRSSFSRKKKREAMEENEKIKSGLAQVYADFQTANDMGKTAEKTVPYIGDGVKLNEKDNILDFANNTWYDRGAKFTRDGMTLNGSREDENGNIVSYDQRLSDISFPKAVKGLGGTLVRKNADTARATSLNGTQIDDAAFDVMKQEYVQQLKNMPVEEQRHLYFNGLGGFEGSSQAETDAAKAMGLDADGFKNMKALINEDDPNYDAIMKQREEFDKQMNILTTRKDFLTPEMVDNQWSTVKAAYQSGMDEYNRKTQVKKDDRAEQRALNEASRNRTNKNKTAKGQNFSFGYRSNEQLAGISNQLKDVLTKQSGEVQLPNGVKVNWDGEKKVFTSKDSQGVYEINPQKIVNIFEGYYTQDDLFGGFDFTLAEIEDNNENQDNQDNQDNQENTGGSSRIPIGRGLSVKNPFGK
jgi:hypothetical protein